MDLNEPAEFIAALFAVLGFISQAAAVLPLGRYSKYFKWIGVFVDVCGGNYGNERTDPNVQERKNQRKKRPRR